MALKRNGIKIARQFLDEASKVIDIERAIMFGSHVYGSPGKYSDIDIAIISVDFKGLNTIERLTLLGKIAWQAKTTEIEALGYTPKEYREATKFDLLYEIRRKGRLILKNYPTS